MLKTKHQRFGITLRHSLQMLETLLTIKQEKSQIVLEISGLPLIRRLQTNGVSSRVSGLASGKELLILLKLL